MKLKFGRQCWPLYSFPYLCWLPMQQISIGYKIYFVRRLTMAIFKTSKGKSSLVHCNQVRVRIVFQFSDFLDSSSFSTNPVPSLSFIFHSLLFVRTLIFFAYSKCIRAWSIFLYLYTQFNQCLFWYFYSRFSED